MEGRQSLGDLIDLAPVNRFHIQVFLICFATAIVDGFDNQMVGFSAAAISADLNIPLASFGGIFSAGSAGAIIGAMLLGTIADKIGRKRSLNICTILFASLTIATASAQTTEQLITLRLIAGIGLGGAMPIFVTLVSEYAPRSKRALATGVLWCGYPIGGLLGSAIGAYLVPAMGWQSVFVLGGCLAVLVALLQLLALPESVQFLALRPGNESRIAAIVSRLDPSAVPEQVAISANERTTKSSAPVWGLFTQGRSTVTLLLWTPLFCTFLITNFFVLWGPPLLKETGYTIHLAAIMVALNNFAAVPSQALAGFVIDRKGPFLLVIASYLGLAAATLGLAGVLHVAPVVGLMMIVIGLLQGPGIAGMVYVATRVYPPEMRSTGVGWAVGIGRTGQIFGALVIGAAVANDIAPRTIFAGVAVPALLAMISALLLQRMTARRPQEFPEPQRRKGAQ